MFKCLNLPAETNVEYKPHKDALKHLVMHTNNAQQPPQQKETTVESPVEVVVPTTTEIST